MYTFSLLTGDARVTKNARAALTLTSTRGGRPAPLWGAGRFFAMPKTARGGWKGRLARPWAARVRRQDWARNADPGAAQARVCPIC